MMFVGRCAEALLLICGNERASQPGHVYFVQAEDGGPVKIGYTGGRSRDWVANRLGQLQTASPYRLVVRAAFPAHPVYERMLHDVFAADRVQGEWFAISHDRGSHR